MLKLTLLFLLCIILSSTSIYATGDKGTYTELSTKDLTNLLKNNTNPEAQYEIGLRYALGKDVVQNNKEAFFWFRKAAKQGYVPAQYRLGVCYDTGYVPLSMEETAKCFLIVSEQGMAAPQYDFDVCNPAERNIPLNYRKALKWYSKAAKKGHHEAQLCMGNMYYNGKGVVINNKKAYYWWLLASDNENPEIFSSATLYSDLAMKKLTPQEIARTQKEVQGKKDKQIKK